MTEIISFKTGLVIESVGGVCTVSTPEGIVSCLIRGRIKNEGLRILPGDKVKYAIINGKEGVIEEVHPRKSLIKRPFIANVSKMIAVCSLVSPSPDFTLLDRLLISTAHQGIEALIVWNKCDLVSEKYRLDVSKPYTLAGYKNIYTNALQGVGIQELLENLSNHLSVLAGPSGVGKSSLLNSLIPGLRLKTGEVSRKIARGRHTTRSVRLISLSTGGWIADSPGFSVLDISEVLPQQLKEYYPEMAGVNGCRFSGCLHQDEPDCEVKDLLTKGSIDYQRYRRYLQFLKELQLLQERKF